MSLINGGARMVLTILSAHPTAQEAGAAPLVCGKHCLLLSPILPMPPNACAEDTLSQGDCLAKWRSRLGERPAESVSAMLGSPALQTIAEYLHQTR